MFKKSVDSLCKNFAIHFLIFTFCSDAFALNFVKSTFLVGASLSEVDNAALQSGGKANNPSYGYHMGATSQYSLNRALAVRSGLIYNQRNNSYTLPSNVDLTTNVNYTYLDVPLHLVLESEKLSIFLGPVVGIKIGGTPSGDRIGHPNVANQALIYPLQYGIGYIFDRHIELQIMAETQTRLTTIQPGTIGTPGPSSDVKASAYILRFGYSIF